MKKINLLLIAILISPLLAAASSGTGGVPSAPCYIDGKMTHTSVPITECIRDGGSPSKSA